MKYDSHDRAVLAGITQKTLPVLKAFHRHGGFTTVERLETGGRIYAGRLDDLEIRSLPPSVSEPRRDVYFSINGLRSCWRTGALVSHLNAIYVDIDFHEASDPDSEIGQAIQRFNSLVNAGTFPPPSVVAQSGRGFWIHYLLRQPGTDRSVLATRETRQMWDSLQGRLSHLFEANGLRPDPNSRDASRLTRIPDSLNSKSGTGVFYEICGMPDGRPRMHTMSELDGWLPRVSAPVGSLAAVAQFVSPARRNVRTPNRRNGLLAVIEYRLRDFDRVRQMRGGKFKQGDRNAAAYIYSGLLRADPARPGKVRHFGKWLCSPKLSDSEINAALKQTAPWDGNTGKRGWRITNITIARMLNFTPGELSGLDGDYTTVRAPRPRFANQRFIAKVRQELIQARYGLRGTVREVQRALRDEQGIVASRGTVAAGMKHSALASGVGSYTSKIGQRPSASLRIDHDRATRERIVVVYSSGPLAVPNP
jgi:hypothetical protein